MQAAMDALVESSQGDMRVVLGQLQMHRLRAASLSYTDVQSASVKDMDKSPFECARLLLSMESARLRISDRMDCVFQDMDLVPLLIQARPDFCSSDSRTREQVICWNVALGPALCRECRSSSVVHQHTWADL
jgi:hypothetical protein